METQLYKYNKYIFNEDPAIDRDYIIILYRPMLYRVNI